MKRFLLPFIFLLPFLSNAQNDWAPVGAKWNFLEHSFDGPEIRNRTIISIADTVIQGIDCRILSGFSGCSPISVTNLFVYSEGQKVFYFNVDSQAFCLLYDFGLNPGESWTIYFNPQWSGEMDSLVLTVTDTSSIIVNGERLKVQMVDQSSFDYYMSGEMIEKIGDTYFLFPQYGACDPPTGPLVCYQDSVLGLYETGEAPSCDYTNVGINENKFPSLEIFPNPAHDFLYLKNTSQKLNYKILDYTGRVILSGKTEKEINVQTLSPGYYRVVFEDEVSRAFLKM
ncbi:MAG: hypothetical protein POELPBGB_00267 [Bacteroidia bacterium]|nr:hypothetical protein [Bacteroidia bacterium]